jgi:hypothetical protein
MLRSTCSWLPVFVFAVIGSAAAVADDYAIVVAKATNTDADWHEVVTALQNKHADSHDVSIIEYGEDVTQVVPELKKCFPRYTCVVARPEDAGREFVAHVHQLTRKLDDDPYTDTHWGILTGYDAAAASRIAKHSAPLTVRKVGSGTELAMEMIEEGVWYCELNKNKMVRKEKGGQAKEEQGPDDTTKALVDSLNKYRADLFVTSGHATERDWQIGFRYRNGSFRCEDGKLYGLDTAHKKHPVDSPNPKVYMPIGNCLMGHIDSSDAMALAWMNSAGVNQMLGYTVPTWFGYAGWGCLDYFVEQPGRYTFTQAFFANHHALVHRLATEFTLSDGTVATRGEGRGLAYDRDVVAFYGDPAWQAKMAEGETAWKQSLTVDGNKYTLTIEPRRGAETFKPISLNGSQRGWRPIVEFLPRRIKNVKVISGEKLKPVITDDFLLVPNPRECDPNKKYEVVFEADVIDE